MNEPRKDIVNRLRQQDNYQKACQRENEVWGRVFSNPERAARLAEVQEAAKQLRVNRDRLQLHTLLKKHGIKPQVGLSLACGSGRAERGLMQHGICNRFDGIDISEKAIDEARRLANIENMDIQYSTADLNKVQLEPESYDLVVTQNCLHHVLELEHLAKEIWKSLRPGGVLWIDDFIGESQFQWSEQRMTVAQGFHKYLPEDLRWDSINQRNHVPTRPIPGKLISPFEAIRSGDIVPIFKEHFEVLDQSLTDSILYLVATKGSYPAFAVSERGREMFEFLWKLDRMLIESNILAPLAGQFLMVKKTNSGGAES